MDELSGEIAEIRARLAVLEEKLSRIRSGPRCPKCGGIVSRSTRFPRQFCMQEYGYCGFLVLHPINPRAGDGSWPKAHFTRTSWDDSGKIGDLSDYTYEPGYLQCFVAGRRIASEEYFIDVEVKGAE